MRLAQWRKANGFTQVQLAEQLGVSQPYISMIERWPSIAAPTRDIMLKIIALTDGLVLPNDFFPIADVLAEARAAARPEAA